MTAAEKLRTAAAGLVDVLTEAADYHSPDCPDRVVRERPADHVGSGSADLAAVPAPEVSR